MLRRLPLYYERGVSALSKYNFKEINRPLFRSREDLYETLFDVMCSENPFSF